MGLLQVREEYFDLTKTRHLKKSVARRPLWELPRQCVYIRSADTDTQTSVRRHITGASARLEHLRLWFVCVNDYAACF